MIKSIFDVKIFHQNLGITFDTKLFEEIKKEIHGNTIPIIKNGGTSSYYTDIKYNNDIRLEKLISKIEHVTNEAWLSMGYRKDLKPLFKDYWINVIYPDGSMKEQVHSETSKIFGVYHLYAPENCGDMVIDHPFDGYVKNVPMEPENGLYNYKITPKTGDLILFPSYTKYYTNLNKSREDKITLEFRCMYQLR